MVLVVASFVFGGQSVEASLAQAIPQLLAVGALAWFGCSARASDFVAGSRVAATFVGAMLLLVALQVVPLPFGWWSALPGRAALVPAVQLADQGRWLALSEDPVATLQSALSLLPAVAMLAIGLTLDREGLRLVMLAIAACAFASLIFGLLQFLASADSALYIYGEPEARQALGLFSNRNHQAAALCIGLLLAAALQYAYAPRSRLLRENRLLVASGVAALFGLGVIFTASRTGMLLFVPCAIFVLVAAYRDGKTRSLTPQARTGLLVVLLLFLAIGWAGLGVLAERMGNFRDLRFAIWPDAWYLAQSAWPVGTGFGTFALAYQRVESLEGVTPLFANAAHNDYLQLLIEGGLPAILLVLAFFGWFGRRTVQLARHGEGMAGWCAAAGILVLLLHSAVDYPLRTEALSTAFAALCVVLNLARLPAPASTPVLTVARHLDALEIAGGESCPAFA